MGWGGVGGKGVPTQPVMEGPERIDHGPATGPVGSERVFHPPVPLDRALSDLREILGSPSLRLLQETPRHPMVMETVLKTGAVTGNLIHDAHNAALCLEHGVSELLTGDRDFERFEGLTVVDPY